MQNFSICPIASGSKGNSYLITNEKTNILLDLGISLKALKSGLFAFGKSPEDLSAIVVTHEHLDHTKGIGAAVRKLNIPVYATMKTWRAMYHSLAPIPDEIIKIVEKKKPFYIEDIELCAFSINHDAADPVGYSFFFDGKKISAATDTGMADEALIEALKGSLIALIEANHDKNMLMMGKYPLSLKQRICSKYGHLSNEDAAILADYLVNSGTKCLLLGHLSEENNYSEVAYLTVKDALGKKADNIPLYVVPPHTKGESFSI